MLLSSAPLNSVGWRSWHYIISTAASQQLPITSSQHIFWGTLEHLCTFLHLYHYHLVTSRAFPSYLKTWAPKRKSSTAQHLSSHLPWPSQCQTTTTVIHFSHSASYHLLDPPPFKVMIFAFPFSGYITLTSTANLSITESDLFSFHSFVNIFINNLLPLSYLYSFLPSPLSSLLHKYTQSSITYKVFPTSLLKCKLFLYVRIYYSSIYLKLTSWVNPH